MHNINDIARQTGRIEGLIRKLESSADADSLATAQELIRSLMDLYAAGLERMTEIVADKREAGREILAQFGSDELVSNLLAANGLHPLDLEARVRQEVDRLHSRLRSACTIELLGIEEGVVRLRLRSTDSGSGSNGATLKATVEAAIYGAAPDVAKLVIEGLETHTMSGFVPLEQLTGAATYKSAHINGTGA